MASTYRRLGSLLVSVGTWLREHRVELTKFAVVGVAGVFVNLATFNLLRLGPLAPDAEVAGGADRVVTAKIIATLVTIVLAWVAHRLWTFRDQRTQRRGRELALFGLVNAVALGVEAATVALSHHGLGYTSLMADNVASLIGIGLGTITRYIGYKLLVFRGITVAATPEVHSGPQ
jgi:putative flippase GtrA